MLSRNVDYRPLRLWLSVFTLASIAIVMAVSAAGRAGDGKTRYEIGPVTDVSLCPGQNAEVHQAVDQRLGYVYEVWKGCGGVALARSTDGGRSYKKPVSVPNSAGVGADDASVAVAPDGTVYAAFMVHAPDRSYPVVAASFDHGLTFAEVTSLFPSRAQNWGDADFIAIGPDGAVYVTWDYGPSSSSVRYLCATGGSCSFANGDLNVVIQRSTDRGKTFGPMSYVSPGFPASGADSAPLVVEPSGRIDVVYQGYTITDASADRLGPGYSYFTSSTDHGFTWSPPVRVGSQAGKMSTGEWWIDGDISTDAADNLYATWDTQGKSRAGHATDIGWLSFSTDHGRRWSAPIQVPADELDVPHITEVVGGRGGVVYVGWLSDSNPLGYAVYLRAFSIDRGWLSAPIQVSRAFGSKVVWPGDTFGIATSSPDRVIVSWGSATPGSGKKSHIFATSVAVSIP